MCLPFRTRGAVALYKQRLLAVPIYFDGVGREFLFFLKPLAAIARSRSRSFSRILSFSENGSAAKRLRLSLSLSTISPFGICAQTAPTLGPAHAAGE